MTDRNKTLVIEIVIVLLAVAMILVLICTPKEMTYYEIKVAYFKAENASVTPGETDVLFLGDSLTDNYNVVAYFPEYKVLNRGINGDSTHGVEKRLKVSVYDVQPKAVVMLIGINNLGTMFENYENLLKGFKENLPDAKIYLVSLTPLGGTLKDLNANVSVANERIRAYAEKYGYVYADLYAALYDEEVGGLPDAYTVEGLHFTEEGYEVITAFWRDMFTK